MTIWWIAIGTPRWLTPRKSSSKILLQPPCYDSAVSAADSNKKKFSDNLKNDLPRIVSGANGNLVRSTSNEKTTTC
jgi:hypothetical protein